MDSSSKARLGKAFQGTEFWSSPRDKRGNGAIRRDVEFNDYVRVISILQILTTGASVKSKSDPKIYRFSVMVHKRALASEKDSGLRLITIDLPVQGVKKHTDYLRVRRRFEMEANAFNNRTRAKKPNYMKKFAEIDLRHESWCTFYPGI